MVECSVYVHFGVENKFWYVLTSSWNSSIEIKCLCIPAVDLRLVDSGDGSRKWGRLEIRNQEVWGHICDHTWSDEAADVACRQLGFKGGIAYGTYNTPRKIAWISHLKCTGKESRLEDCSTGSKQLWEPYFGCTAASVLCYNNSGMKVTQRCVQYINFYVKNEQKNSS